MCGIAGIVAHSGWTKQALEEVANSMASTLQHRGPDAQGVWLDPLQPLALAHQRLSIQDLSPAGSQPMSSAQGRFHIVFNGEIYNFQKIADELRQLGHRFRGHSDTEVLLASLEEWGVAETLKRSHGMFAFAVWDMHAQELILCRDRMGEKPLFFGWLDNCFVFASEMKAFQKNFHRSLVIDNDSVAAFFRFGYVPSPHSIYKNIFKLLPGTYLRLPVAPLPSVYDFNPMPSNECFSPKSYWQLESVARQGVSNLISDEKNAIDQLDALLIDSIRQQKIADVPIGAFLSGGVDSSLVSAVMQSLSDTPISTFTIGFKEKEFDEAPYARAIAKHLGTDHHECYISANDGLDLIEGIPKYWDEPFADSSQIPSLLVAKMARNKVKVCLTGDGGDELFCGYNRYFSMVAFCSKTQRLPHYLRQICSAALSSISPNTWQRAYAISKTLLGSSRTQANVGLKIQKIVGLMQLDTMRDSYRYLMSSWSNPNEIFNHTEEADNIMDRQPNPNLGSFINDAMYWDQLGYLVDDNLVKGDRSSMVFGLETRLPLLSPRIIELSWRLPMSMKYRNGQSKWLLRQVLYRYIPRVLIERPKMGFSVPVSDWLKGPLKSWGEDLIYSNSTREAPCLNQNEIHRVWLQHQKGSHDHSQKLWTTCIWLSWLNEHGY